MAKVFIVRPFGDRSVLKKDKATGITNAIQFNFDKVEKELIKPAMKKLKLSGGTTGEVFEAGDIREDMFSELLLADIVIADITIYNANVFYELGIRHALRDKRTILIKCPGFDDTPFDIIGFRYVSYLRENPAEALQTLIKSLEETIAADRQDSPVFKVLPLLVTQDPEKFVALPEDFTEEVRIAGEIKAAGKLALLAYEAEGYAWKIPAYRLVGETLYNIKAFAAAKLVWEKILDEKPHDRNANDRLATIYQRLAEAEMKTNMGEGLSFLVKSDIAIETLFNDKSLNNVQIAEAYALKARNAKTRWFNSWKELQGDTKKIRALQSVHLDAAFKYYEKGYYENLNHFYSGINALGLLTITISLAENYPDTWELAYETKDDADRKTRELKAKCQRLAATVHVSIEAAKSKLDTREDNYKWLIMTEADYVCLTADNAKRVTAIYNKALDGASSLNMDSTIHQLKIYEALDVKPDNTNAALATMPAVNEVQKQTAHYLLFTGHMIDKVGRKTPRFPASKEAAAKQLIKEKVLEEQGKLDEGNYLIGIAGGACGGDILFLETCVELGIPAQMHLALSREKFLVESVAFAGNNWVERFDRLCKKLPHPVLLDDKELPKWLHKKEDYNIWTRTNLWLLESALVNGGMNMTLIALWDKKGGDGAGGTEHMVKEAEAKGGKVIVLDVTKL